MKKLLLTGIFVVSSTLAFGLDGTEYANSSPGEGDIQDVLIGKKKAPAKKEFKGLKQRIESTFKMKLKPADENEYSRILKYSSIRLNSTFYSKKAIGRFISKLKKGSGDYTDPFKRAEIKETFYSMDDFLKLSQEEIVVDINLKWEGCPKGKKHCSESDYLKLPEEGINLNVVCKVTKLNKSLGASYYYEDSTISKMVKIDHAPIVLKNDVNSLNQKIKFKLDDDTIEAIRLSHCDSDDLKVFVFNISCSLRPKEENDYLLTEEIFKEEGGFYYGSLGRSGFRLGFIDRDQIEEQTPEEFEVESGYTMMKTGFFKKAYFLKTKPVVSPSYILLESKDVDYKDIISKKMRESLLLRLNDSPILYE